MTDDFFRFPQTPHLAWLGNGETPRDDKVLSPAQAGALLADKVVVEEKLDGANLGCSLAPDGSVRFQNRGQYLIHPHAGQFSRLPAWLAQHEVAMRTALRPGLILFGEWCAARHSLDYSALPDWFLVFDVYDRAAGRFWDSAQRNILAAKAGLATVPCILCGHTSLTSLKQILTNIPSRFRNGQPMEGLVVRQESDGWCQARAKLVGADFTQAIDTHWRKRALEWNRVDWMQPENGPTASHPWHGPARAPSHRPCR